MLNTEATKVTSGLFETYLKILRKVRENFSFSFLSGSVYRRIQGRLSIKK